MKNSKKYLVLFTMGLLVATITMALVDDCSAASTIYVNGTSGDDNNNGETPNTAKKTIKNATGTVDANGAVLIADGLYTGTNNRGITIDRDMTITGQSTTGTIIDAQGLNWIISIPSGLNVVISNLTMANGNAVGNYGAAIRNEGMVTVKNCAFTGNTASFSGAIGNVGTCTVIDCTFTGNSAIINGGAIANDGILVVTGSNFTGNTAGSNGGAIASDGTLTVSECNFIANNAVNGGAISNLVIGPNIGTAQIHFCRIINNSAIVGNAISNVPGGLVNAENNWWGSNNPDFTNLTSGVVDYTPWLYMTISANPTIINNGETSLITTSFNNQFDGTTVTPLDPVAGHIPDGTPVTFNTDLGNIGTIDKKTINGVATATLTADETAGIAHVNAVTDAQTVNTEVTINPRSSLYLTITPSKTNPVVGDTVIYTLKVGNNGPDPAENVIMTYTIPEGLEFAGANVDMGNYIYDSASRTITWTIGDVPVIDPYMWLSLKIGSSGTYLLNPQLSTSTYDPTLNNNTQSLTINVAATPSNNTNNTQVKAVSMQDTGMPLIALILALFMVLGGIFSSKK